MPPVAVAVAASPPAASPSSPPPRARSTLDGPQKAAALILGLDEEAATELLRHLSPAELRQLGPAVDALRLDDMSELEGVFNEFAEAMERPALPRSGGAYLRRLASAAFGAEHAARVLAPDDAPRDPVEALRAARTSTLAELLADEHPQVAAVILTRLGRDQAAKVLLGMAPDQQVDLLGRLGELEEIPVSALEAASEVMARALESSGVTASTQEEFDGVAFAAGLLNEMPANDSERLLEAVATASQALAPRLREAMFTFEDLGRLDKRALGQVMREVPGDQLRLALRQASESLRELFLSSVASRVAAEIREDLEIMPPVRLSEIEKAQRAVVDVVVRMAGEGQIQLPAGGSEEMV